MKNLWFIFIGIVIVLILSFIMFTDGNLNSLLRTDFPKKVPQQIQTHLKRQNNSSPIITEKTKKSNIAKGTAEQTIQKELSEDEQIYREEIAETHTEEIIIKPISNPIVKISTLSIESAVKVIMKIKAREKAGIVKAKVSIRHDMFTYAQAKKKGREANFITHITGLIGKKIVYDSSTSQFLSKNPLIKFSFKGRKGEELTIIYQQLKGETFYDSKKIK